MLDKLKEMIYKINWLRVGRLFIFILVIISVNVIYNIFRGPQYTQEQVQAITSKLETYKNKNGELVAKNKDLSATNSKYILELNSSQEDIQKLQATLKKNKNKLGNTGSVSVAGTNFNYSENLTQNKDTLTFKDDYTDLKVKLPPDPNFTLLVKSEVELVHGEDKNGEYTEYVDKNPHAEVQYLKSYRQKSKKNIFDKIDYIIGYGATASMDGKINHSITATIGISLK